MSFPRLPTLRQRQNQNKIRPMNIIAKWIAPYVASWKTTLVGVGMIGSGIALLTQTGTKLADGELDTTPAMEGWAMILAGIGFIAGRDANKSSQDSNIRS
jgi:hypothetical protein